MNTEEVKNAAESALHISRLCMKTELTDKRIGFALDAGCHPRIVNLGVKENYAANTAADELFLSNRQL